MFSNLATKLALKKAGISPEAFIFSSKTPKAPKTSDDRPSSDDDSPWPAWMSVKALPVTVQPWLAPPPPPIPVGQLPKVGEFAPRDGGGKIVCGRGPVLVVFLRCVGCACKCPLPFIRNPEDTKTPANTLPVAQKTFLTLRTLANHYTNLRCLAISHSSPAATRKWLDLLGGAWAVSTIHDDDLSLYATWGLGPATLWSVLNPATQI